jgi:GNAT superfamily N-acetyltransferase
MDMLIKLYPPQILADESAAANARWRLSPESADCVVRKPIGPEHATLIRWVADTFTAGWASEIGVALANRPVSVWIAARPAELLGFACFDATARGYFGPVGIAESARGKGLGAVLLHACLQDMRAWGYGYAIAGFVGAPKFFKTAARATEIADSSPGLYADQLKG